MSIGPLNFGVHHLLGTVDTIRNLSLAEQDRKLAAGTGGNNLLAPDGGVIDQGGLLNVLDSALARLVVAGKAPGVSLAVTSDSEAIVRTGGDGDNVRDFCGIY